jgi:hypothetical protein
MTLGLSLMTLGCTLVLAIPVFGPMLLSAI